MSSTTENEVPREHVIHEREIVTERRRNPVVSFLVAIAALAVIAMIVVVAWAALDDDGSIGSEAEDIQNDLTDGR